MSIGQEIPGSSPIKVRFPLPTLESSFENRDHKTIFHVEIEAMTLEK